MSSRDIEDAITSAFDRRALLDAEKILVETSGNEVTLSGEVGNYLEREEAERVASAASGVYAVNDKITIESFWDDSD